MGLTFKTSKSHSGPDYTKTWLVYYCLVCICSVIHMDIFKLLVMQNCGDKIYI